MWDSPNTLPQLLLPVSPAPTHLLALHYTHPVLSHPNSPQMCEAFSHGHIFAHAVSSAKNALSSHPSELLLSLQNPTGTASVMLSQVHFSRVDVFLLYVLILPGKYLYWYTFHTLWQWLVCISGNSP